MAKDRWEFPAGHLESGETPLEAAIREFGEETGTEFPADATQVGSWVSDEEGNFQGFVFRIEHEADFELGQPDGIETDAISWWDADDLDDKHVRGVIRDQLDVTSPMFDQAAKAAQGYSLHPRSGMVSLDVPPGTIPPVPGGVDDHHITIVYLGSDVDDDRFKEVCAIARAIANTTTGPLQGSLSGIGSFPPSPSSDGLIPVFVNPTVPGIEALRAPLERFNGSQFKDFHPHMTLAYLEESDPLPAPLEEVPVSFTHLSVHRGDMIIRYPFRGCSTPQDRFADNVMARLATPLRQVSREELAARKRYLTRAEALAGRIDPSLGQDEPVYLSDDLEKANPGQRRARNGKWRVQKPVWEDFHTHTDEIVDYYATVIAKAMAEVVPQTAIEMAISASSGGFAAKASQPLPANQQRAVDAAAAPFPTGTLSPAGIGLSAATYSQGVAVAASTGAAALAGTGVAALAGTAVSVSSAVAAAAAILLIGPIALRVLRDALANLYGDAILQGAWEAMSASGGQMPLGLAEAAADLPDDYWSEWEPGHGAGAAMTAQGELGRLAQQIDTWTNEIADTLVYRIADAIVNGARTHNMTQARVVIDKIVHDAAKAKLIADTEFVRAYNEAAMATYRTSDVEHLYWIAMPGACDRCLENEAASPQPVRAPNWPNGGLPVHPNERCAIAPG